MEKTATARYIRVTPRKMRAVGDLIKGLSVNEAEAQLMNNPRRSAKPLLKLLRSAVANVKSSDQPIDKLMVKNVTVDKGPMLKRSLPRARGSASPIHKVMSHITITMVASEKVKAPRFTIVVPKKVKDDGDKKSRTRKRSAAHRSHDQGTEGGAKRDEGLLKRVFSRKTGSAE